jgi:hypothetical protein
VQEGMKWIHDQLFNVQGIASRLTREQMKLCFRTIGCWPSVLIWEPILRKIRGGIRPYGG